MSPYRASRPCPGRGPRSRSCPNLIRGNMTCCPDCMPFEKQATRRYDKARDESPGRQFLHSMQWRKEREIYLNENPLCERCLKQDLTIPAYLVHHRDHNELNRAKENKESLCNSCHEAEHKRWGK